MYRKIAVLLSLVVTVLSFTGCTSTGRNYIEALEKTNEWDAYQIELSGKFEGVFQDETYYDEEDLAEDEEITSEETRTAGQIKVEGYINEADEEGHLIINILNEEWGEMPTLDLFFNKEMCYINKDYLLAANDTSRFDKFKEKYIACPLTDEIEAIVSTREALEWNKKSTEILNAIEVDIPFKESEGTYTLALDHKALMDIIMAYGKGIYENREEILGGYAELMDGDTGYSVGEAVNDLEEGMENVFKNEDKVQLYTSLIGPLFEGTSLKMTTSFSDQAMKTAFKGKLQYLDTIDVDVDMTFNKQKAQKRQITFPKDIKILTSEEFEQYSNPFVASYYLYNEHDNISIDKVKKAISELGEYDYLECFKANGEWYLDLETLTSYLNYTSRYDKSKGKYYLVADEEMTYDKVYEALNALDAQYESEEMTDEVYNQKAETIWASLQEVKGAKRLYMNTVKINDYVFVTLSELHKLGFESKEKLEEGEYKEYFAAYLDVYEPIK